MRRFTWTGRRATIFIIMGTARRRYYGSQHRQYFNKNYRGQYIEDSIGGFYRHAFGGSGQWQVP